MSWTDQLKGDSLTWLLEDENPNIRYLALRDLLDKPENDGEVQRARQGAYEKGPIAEVLCSMQDEGYWIKPGAGYNPKYRGTAWSIILLAQCGASLKNDGRIKKAVEYVLEHTLMPGGQFTSNGVPSGTIDCLQGNLCWALTKMGCDDPRLDNAYDWMARTVTGEGLEPAENTKATLRYYSYKCRPDFACGANGKRECAWGATKVMMALSSLEKEKYTERINKAIGQGIDFLLSVDPAEANYPTRTGDKPNRSWWHFGFPVFYITDLLQTVEALVNLGCQNDKRLTRSLELIREKQDEQGRWRLEYSYEDKTWGNYGDKRQPNKWVTLRALRVLKGSVKI